jgi:hypothetical protein
MHGIVNAIVPLPDELSFATGAAISCGTGCGFESRRATPILPSATVSWCRAL